MQVDDDKSYDDINVTPMVDLYLVLLLIFIIMTTAGVQGMKVKLPDAPSAPAIGEPKTEAITVNPEGKFFHNTVPVTLDQLEARLNAAKSKNPKFPVIVRGDDRTHYQGIAEVLNVLGRVGVEQIGLATGSSK